MSKYSHSDVPEDIKNRFPTLSRVVVGENVQAPITQSRVIPTTTFARPTVLPLQTSQSFIQPTVQPLSVIQTRFGPRPENAQLFTDADVPEEIKRRFPQLANINRNPVNLPFNQPLAQSTIIPQQYEQQQPEGQEQDQNGQGYEEQ